MLFTRHSEFRSNLTQEEIADRLGLLVCPFGTNAKDFQKFKGKVTSTGFKIYLIPEISEYNTRFNIEVIGEVLEEKKSILIRVKCRIPMEIRLLGILAIVFNLGIVIFLACYPPSFSKLAPFNSWWKWLLFLISICFVFMLIFHSRAHESINILKSALKARSAK
jgi:hypothetical protein